MTWRFRVTRELFELIADIRDFTTLFYVILRRETSGRFIKTIVSTNYVKTENIKCDVCFIIVTPRKAFRPLLHEVDEWLGLGSSIESDLGMRFPICSLYLAFLDFAFFKHSF